MTRKQMTFHGALHPRADVDSLYVSRKKGGRALRSIAEVVALEKASLAEYVENANEPILRKLKDEEMVKYENPLQEKKQHIFRERETRWKNKVLYGNGWKPLTTHVHKRQNGSGLHTLKQLKH